MSTSAYNKYMEMALNLARKAMPSPNPRVGAVLIRDGRILGCGYHEAPGAPHAEIVALTQAGTNTQDATMVVTLEPCNHHGRTGPCSEALINAGIRHVVVGMRDPDKKVSGTGIMRLREHGCTVTENVLENECQALLQGYSFHRTHNRPFVHLKAAITLDGYIATQTGDSKWITGPQARQHVHTMRGDSDGIVIGAGTLRADNPELTNRDASGPSPTRIVLDTHLTISVHSRLLETRHIAPIIVVHHPLADPEKKRHLDTLDNVSTLTCSRDENGHLCISELLTALEANGMLSVMVEGGGAVHNSFIQAGAADWLSVFIAPKLLGTGTRWTSFPGISSIKDALFVHDATHLSLGPDLLIQGRLTP